MLFGFGLLVFKCWFSFCDVGLYDCALFRFVNSVGLDFMLFDFICVLMLLVVCCFAVSLVVVCDLRCLQGSFVVYLSKCYGVANWRVSGFVSYGAFGFGWAVLIAVWGCFVSCLIVLFSLLCFSLVVLFVYVRLWWVGCLVGLMVVVAFCVCCVCGVGVYVASFRFACCVLW